MEESKLISSCGKYLVAVDGSMLDKKANSKRKLLRGVGTNDWGFAVAKEDGQGGVIPSVVYRKWADMLRRGDKSVWIKRPHYSGVSVAQEWLTFSSFARWFVERTDTPAYELDKDILVPGNRHYSPQTCLIIPNWLNTFVQILGRDGDPPVGSHYDKMGKRFRVSVSRGSGKGIGHVGSYRNPYLAAEAYRKAKLEILKGHEQEVSLIQEQNHLSINLLERIAQKISFDIDSDIQRWRGLYPEYK